MLHITDAAWRVGSQQTNHFGKLIRGTKPIDDSSALLQKVVERVDAFALQDGAQFGVRAIAASDVGAVFLPKGANEGIAALAVDFAIPVAMTVVEAWLLHFRLLGDRPTGILTDSLRRCCPYVLYLLIAVAMTYDRAILLERVPVAIAAGMRVYARVCAPA